MKNFFVTAVILAAPARATLLGRDITGNAVAGNDANAVFRYDGSLNEGAQ